MKKKDVMAIPKKWDVEKVDYVEELRPPIDLKLPEHDHILPFAGEPATEDGGVQTGMKKGQLISTDRLNRMHREDATDVVFGPGNGVTQRPSLEADLICVTAPGPTELSELPRYIGAQIHAAESLSDFAERIRAEIRAKAEVDAGIGKAAPAGSTATQAEAEKLAAILQALMANQGI